MECFLSPLCQNGEVFRVSRYTHLPILKYYSKNRVLSIYYSNFYRKVGEVLSIIDIDNDAEQDKKDIVNRLKEIRLKTGLSQAKFGNIIGVSAGNVGMWESGSSLPGAIALKNIALKFDCSIDWLLTGKEIKKLEVIEDPELERIIILLRKMMQGDQETRIWAKKQFEYCFKSFIEEEEERLKKQEDSDKLHVDVS